MDPRYGINGDFPAHVGPPAFFGSRVYSIHLPFLRLENSQATVKNPRGKVITAHVPDGNLENLFHKRNGNTPPHQHSSKNLLTKQ